MSAKPGFLGSPDRAHEHRRRAAAVRRQTPDPANDHYPPRPCAHAFMSGRRGTGCTKCGRIWMLRADS